jgi:succinate dehydrogenase / fumarate reductase membrane anchor subunit
MGSAKHGVGHFIGQRVSAVALLLLTLWGVAAAFSVAAGGYDGARTWLASPVNAALLSLLIIAGVYHAGLGMRTIIEDYIEKPVTKAAFLILNAFIGWGAAALALVSILKVTFGAGS